MAKERFEAGSSDHPCLELLKEFSPKDDRDREGSVARIAIDFFMECLSPAACRPSAAQLLQHPFLADIPVQVHLLLLGL